VLSTAFSADNFTLMQPLHMNQRSKTKNVRSTGANHSMKPNLEKDWGKGQPVVFSHGSSPSTLKDQINADLLAFIKA
jgi:hypothetical protein